VHVDVALDQRAETVVIEVVNTVGAQLTQATLDQALLGHKQAANSHTRRWGGHGLGLRHTAAMLKLLECPPLSLTAKANAVTARFSIPYRPCAPSRSPSTVGSPFDEIDAFNDGGGDGGGGGGGSGVDGDGGTTGEAHSSPAARPAPRLRSVLAVDDEEFIRTLTQLTLEDQCEGCVVVTAENGARAGRTLNLKALSLAP
jgi:CheY-like chemotaxis protein